jgi:hypothetical protein
MGNSEQMSMGQQKTGSDEAAASSGGIKRRTVVQGAAWSVPVIAAAIATPLAAASVAPVLAFINGPYTVPVCGVLADVLIEATTDGTTPVPAGTQVTVTLPAGLTWSDGSTGSRILPTDGNGRVTLSGLVGATQGDVAIVASAGTVSSSAPLQITGNGIAKYWANNGSNASYSSVPPGSAVAGGSAYLAPNGDLYFENTVIGTNVSSSKAVFNSASQTTYVYYVENGVAKYWTPGSAPASYPAVPVGSEALGGSTYLAPNGDLYFENSVIASGVTSANALFNSANGSTYVYYVENGAAKYWANNGASVTYPSVPAGATAIGSSTYLAPNGDLYFQNDIIASGVDSAASTFNAGDGQHYIYYMEDGVAKYWSTNGTRATYVEVPAGSTPLGTSGYLAPNGDLYFENTIVASNVTSAGASNIYNSATGAGYLYYVEGTPCV